MSPNSIISPTETDSCLHSILFYVGGIFCAGLLVPANERSLSLDSGTGASSPFVIALNKAGVRVVSIIFSSTKLIIEDLPVRD